MKAFIGHSSKDHDFVLLLAKKLKKDSIDVWIDYWELKVGDSIVQKINEGLEKSSFLIIVFSENSIKSDWALKELNSTLMRQLTKNDIKILPILLEVDPDELPPLMSDIYSARFSRNFINETEYQKLIEPILERVKSDKLFEYQDIYFENIAHVDMILNKKQPTRQEVRFILELIKEEHYRNYFFKKISALHWFNVLKREGYFKPSEETKPQETEQKGSFFIPQYNVLPYLEIVSQQVNVPGNEKYIDELLKIIREVSNYKDSKGQHIDNYRTWWYFVKILLNLPNDKIPLKIIELISVWLDSKFNTMLPGSEIATKLLPKFLIDDPDDIKKAEKIIEYITSIKTFPVSEEKKKFLEKDKETRLVIDSYLLEKAFKKYSDIIGKKCSEKVIKNLTDKIKSLLKQEKEGTYSSFYEESGHLNKPLDVLTFALKGILLAKAKSDIGTTQEILKDFLKYKYLYFPKMALYVIGNDLDDYKELFWEILNTDIGVSILKNTLSFGDELKHILENLEALNSKQREILKSKIENATEAKLKDFKEDPEKHIDLYKQKIYKALSHDQYFKNLYIEMKKITKTEIKLLPAIGKIETRWGLESSPLTKEKILQMSNDKLAEFLSTFRTKDFWHGPTVDGLSDILKETVKENPKRFIDNLKPFLKTGYLYVYDILWGIRDDLENKKIFDWGKLFNFIQQYITLEDFWNDKYIIESDDWKAKHFWVLGEVGELIKKGTEDDSWAFSEKHFLKAQKIIFHILNRMLLEKGKISENQSVEDDLITYAFNSTFGKITEALFTLALRIKRFEKKLKIKQTVSWEVNIKNKYEELLKNEIVESYVWLGMYLPNFYYLDKNWIENQINQISPKTEQNWEAFMQGYLSTNRINGNLYKLMRPHYEKAIDYEFKDKYSSEKLVQHICLVYLQGIEKIIDKNGLFRKILDKWNLIQAKEVIGWSWMQRDLLMGPIKEKKKTEETDRIEKMKERIVDFWRWVYKKKYKEKQQQQLDEEDKKILSDLSKLAVFLEKIDCENYEWLKLSAPYVHIDFNSPFFIEYLDNLKDKDKDAGKYVGEIFLKILKKSTPDYDQKHIRSIVEYLYISDFENYADKICNIYGHGGHEFLRDIYQKYHKEL